jgi:hypothetical protein
MTAMAKGPAALVRLDAALVDRIKRGEGLRAICSSSLATIAIGGAAYGAAFGLWRGAEQSLYVAIKLPILLVAIAAFTFGVNALLAILFKAKLGFAQSATAILVSFAIIAAILGALAPVAFFLAANAPPPDPRAVGLAMDDPIVLPSMRVARALLLFHVVVIATAGIAGIVRLRGLLSRLIEDASIARRVLLAWLVVQAMVGSELSWLFRPFMGKPHLPPGFLRQEALHGNFIEEVGTLLVSALGPAGPWVALVTLASAAVWIVVALSGSRNLASIVFEENGIVLERRGSPAEHVPWSEIASVAVNGFHVAIERNADVSFVRARWEIECGTRADARALAEKIERERGRVREGPFRTLAL